MPRYQKDSIAVGESALVAITGHDIALLVNGVQYGDDVGVLTQVDRDGEGIVSIYILYKKVDGENRLRLMDSRGYEFVGDVISDIQNIGDALSNYFRVDFAIDDVAADIATVSGPIYRLPSSGRFDPVGFRYSANQISYIPVMSRMSEGDEFAVFVNGIYVLNRLERSGSTLVYRTYILPCNPAVEDSGLVFGFVGGYNQGFDINESETCFSDMSSNSLADWWDQVGVEPLPYQFERVVYYTDSLRLMPLLFVKY